MVKEHRGEERRYAVVGFEGPEQTLFFDWLTTLGATELVAESWTKAEACSRCSLTLLNLPEELESHEASKVIRGFVRQNRLFCIAPASLGVAFCLEHGAHDAVCRPWDFDETLVRIGRLISEQPLGRMIPIEKDSAISLETGEVLAKMGQAWLSTGRAVRRAELKVFCYLAECAPRFVSSEELQRCVLRTSGDGSAVRTQIKELRRILGFNCIECKKGLGYRLRRTSS